MRQGTNLQVAYFDQMRDALDLDATLADTISPGSEWIEIGNQRKHVMSYLGDFLFSPARASSPVRSLSGGERNRLLLARLFARPANVLVLDEPTNDLDIDTLELLEDLLQDYDGTVFLVSHDRAFLDNVVTSTIVFEGDGLLARVRRRRAGLAARSRAARRRWRRPRRAAAGSRPPAPRSAAAARGRRPRRARKKLSYKEQRELDALPALIEALEQEQKQIHERTRRRRASTAATRRAPRCWRERSAQIDDELMAALERWEMLGSAP